MGSGFMDGLSSVSKAGGNLLSNPFEVKKEGKEAEEEKTGSGPASRSINSVREQLRTEESKKKGAYNLPPFREDERKPKAADASKEEHPEVAHPSCES